MGLKIVLESPKNVENGPGGGMKNPNFLGIGWLIIQKWNKISLAYGIWMKYIKGKFNHAVCLLF